MSAESARGAGHGSSPALVRLMASAAVALLMVGCGVASGSHGPKVSSSGRPGAVTTARDNANGKTVRLSVGERLALILSSSYWSVHGSSAPAVVRQDGPGSLLSRPSTCPAIPGIGCTPVRFWFTALAPGTAVITASRVSCGEALRCRPDQQRFSVTVVVR